VLGPLLQHSTAGHLAWRVEARGGSSVLCCHTPAQSWGGPALDGRETTVLLTLGDVGPWRSGAHLACHVCTGVPAAVWRFKVRYIVRNRAHMTTSIGAALHAFFAARIITAQLYTYTKSTRLRTDCLVLHLGTSRAIVYGKENEQNDTVHATYGDTAHSPSSGQTAICPGRKASETALPDSLSTHQDKPVEPHPWTREKLPSASH